MNKKPNPEPLDADNPEWTPEMFGQAVRLNRLPVSLQAKLRGRPKAAVTKERIIIRLSTDLVGVFRSTGQGCKPVWMQPCVIGSRRIHLFRLKQTLPSPKRLPDVCWQARAVHPTANLRA